MAYKKISDLTAVTTPATTDLVEIEQSGVSYKATVAQITGAPNGGQPPAPKATASSGTPGYCTQGSTTTPSEAGTYLVWSFKSGAFYAFEAGVPNSTNMNTRYSTTGIDAIASWRQS